MRKVVLIDDDGAERAVLRGLLEELGFSVVGEGSSGTQAVDLCRKFSPEVVVMDVTMPGKDGIEATLDINRSSPVPVVLLTARDDPETVRRAAAAGVMAYLVKPVRMEELLPAVELAATRFLEFEELKREVTGLRDALEARKTIEKAKGLIMEKERVSEREAFSRIRKLSMDRRKSMKEIAEAFIITLEKK